MTPQDTAEAVAADMMDKDRASRSLGMQVVRIAPGAADIDMVVREDMLNGFAICHGGYLTLLADSAFAFACNSYDERTVASGLSIEFLAPAHAGDRLTASATEVSRRGRTGVYDVVVRNQNGIALAVFRGRSYSMQGKPVLPAAA